MVLFWWLFFWVLFIFFVCLFIVINFVGFLKVKVNLFVLRGFLWKLLLVVEILVDWMCELFFCICLWLILENKGNWLFFLVVIFWLRGGVLLFFWWLFISWLDGIGILLLLLLLGLKCLGRLVENWYVILMCVRCFVFLKVLFFEFLYFLLFL